MNINLKLQKQIQTIISLMEEIKDLKRKLAQ